MDGLSATIPVSNELYTFAQLGSILPLFSIGLETDPKQFLRYFGPATAVAIGSVVLSLALGARLRCCWVCRGVWLAVAASALYESHYDRHVGSGVRRPQQVAELESANG